MMELRDKAMTIARAAGEMFAATEAAALDERTGYIVIVWENERLIPFFKSSIPHDVIRRVLSASLDLVPVERHAVEDEAPIRAAIPDEARRADFMAAIAGLKERMAVSETLRLTPLQYDLLAMLKHMQGLEARTAQ